MSYKKKEKIVINETHDQKEIVIIDEELENYGNSEVPIKCWNCGNVGVYFWLRQMARADEAPTRFYKCKKCKRVWRSSR